MPSDLYPGHFGTNNLETVWGFIWVAKRLRRSRQNEYSVFWSGFPTCVDDYIAKNQVCNSVVVAKGAPRPCPVGHWACIIPDTFSYTISIPSVIIIIIIYIALRQCIVHDSVLHKSNILKIVPQQQPLSYHSQTTNIPLSLPEVSTLQLPPLAGPRFILLLVNVPPPIYYFCAASSSSLSCLFPLP